MTRKICYNNEELLESVIISVILMPFISDSGMILYGESRRQSLSGDEGLRLCVRQEYLVKHSQLA